MDWSERGVAGVWEPADVLKVVVTPRHVVLHRADGSGPLYLSYPVALRAYGEALRQQSEAASVMERQRAAIVRDKRIDYAVLAFMGLLGAVLLVLSWVRA